MKLQNLIVIFIIIALPVILLISLYISTGLKTIEYQAIYDDGLLNATHDAIYAFEQNTTNYEFSDNPEIKRDILKSSVKMFEKSLCNTCRISSYNIEDIEKYIPAIMFGMYDGFYMYAPSQNSQTGEYKHSLKSYVYYSEILSDGTIIRYSLDNYVVVFSKDFGIKEGYLIDPDEWNAEENIYNGIQIVEETIDEKTNDNAIKYYKKAYEFSEWFNTQIGDKIKDENGIKYLQIDLDNNDPENETSHFVQHKRKVIKEKIEGVLNSIITAYSERIIGQSYKMPKFTEEDWKKIYSNISMVTFFQGKSIGLTKYNGYCVLNSTNSREYVNPNLMYFTDGNGWYHDIRCNVCKSANKLTGYKIGAFKRKKVEKTDDAGNIIYDINGNVEYKYIYDHNELACYECVNAPINTNLSIKEYMESLGNSEIEKKIKTSYYTSLARERYIK